MTNGPGGLTLIKDPNHHAAASGGEKEQCAMNNREKNFDTIVALCKSRGFVFAGSEIYGGLANSWDYGPLGVEFKNNVKKA